MLFGRGYFGGERTHEKGCAQSSDIQFCFEFSYCFIFQPAIYFHSAQGQVRCIQNILMGVVVVVEDAGCLYYYVPYIKDCNIKFLCGVYRIVQLSSRAKVARCKTKSFYEIEKNMCSYNKIFTVVEYYMPIVQVVYNKQFIKETFD